MQRTFFLNGLCSFRACHPAGRTRTQRERGRREGKKQRRPAAAASAERKVGCAGWDEQRRYKRTVAAKVDGNCLREQQPDEPPPLRLRRGTQRQNGPERDPEASCGAEDDQRRGGHDGRSMRVWVRLAARSWPRRPERGGSSAE